MTEDKRAMLAAALTACRPGFADTAVNKTEPCLICKSHEDAQLIFEAARAYEQQPAEPLGAVIWQCVHCKGVYAEEAPTECDCTLGQKNQRFTRGRFILDFPPAPSEG